MASAYAALVSLMNVLDILKHPKNPASSSHLVRSQMQSLFEKVNSLVDILETHSHMISKCLEKKMIDAAFATEDTIESYLVEIQQATKEDSYRSRRRRSRLTRWWMRNTRISVPTITADKTSFPLLTLDKAIHEVDLIVQEAMQAKRNNGEQDDQLLRRGSVLLPDVGSSSTPVTLGDAVKIVGLQEETSRVIDQLTSYESNRQIIPIVGMGGLGKTTLATSVYNYPHLKGHFDIKAWVTISQVYTPRTIFAPLLHDIGVKDIDKIKEEELGEKLHKALFRRRYLVIIDDIWDLKAWDEISRYVPDNNNRSRILLTTRLLDVAKRVSSCSPFDMQLLDADKSWDLLSKSVFGDEGCPPELENCGMRIAMNCKGLPLAIVVIGGILKVSDRTRKHWEHVERNIRSMISIEENEYCTRILSLSYHQLPIHLKPCFLYMATFPEDYKIKVSEVTKLWAADGFLKPRVDGKSLDEVALEHLTDLISRKLIIVSKRNKRGKMKCLTIHDLVRDICIKEAQNEKFLRIDDGVTKLPNSVESERRLVFYGNGSRRISSPTRQMGFSRSFIEFGEGHYLSLEISRLRLLRVLLSLDDDQYFVQCIMQLLNLRLLKCSIKAKSFSSISWALNLETLILSVARYDYHSLPVEIWNLWRLKHLIVEKYARVTLPDPPTGSDIVFENLQTLNGVRVFSDIVLDRIPNIKILNIMYHHDHGIKRDQPPPRFDKFVRCHNLEKLYFELYFNSFITVSPESNYKLPCYLRKLTLWHTRIPWENMTIVGPLPNLENLHLQYDAFVGKEWKSVEGEFEKLTYLEIDRCYLVMWIAEESSHFPSLEHLELRCMWELKEIPEVFGELMTLVSIKSIRCTKSVVVSARQILEEQQQGGNTDLVVDVLYIVRTKYTVELEEELKGLPNDNFHLRIVELDDY